MPSSFATRAIGRDVSITILTASSLNSDEKLFFGRGNYFTFPEVHPNGWTVRKLRGTPCPGPDWVGMAAVPMPCPSCGSIKARLYAGGGGRLWYGRGAVWGGQHGWWRGWLSGFPDA